MKNNNNTNQKKIEQSFNGEIVKGLMPIIYIIEPTNFCNYSCPICPNNKYKPSEKGYMKYDLFEKIIFQIKDYADLIQLYWVGEPLLHHEISKMIALAKKNTNAKMSISTNGSLLTKECIEKLLESGLDEIIVSMDAAVSDDIYKLIRKNGSISILNNNVKTLINYSNQIHIILKFILTNVNISEQELFIKLWSNENVDVKINSLYTWANQMPELKSLSTNFSPQLHKTRKPCSDLWHKIAIHWNGKVSICCFDWTFEHIIGDINEKSINEIWNDSPIAMFRQSQLQGEYLSICKECDAWAELEEYEEII